MVSNSMGMVVAENCDSYNPKNVLNLLSVSTFSESCNNCQNYINGKCSKELFNKIAGTIRRN